MTAFSQTISLEEIRKRTLKDSATYSWEQVNEIANGLENEAKLDTAFNILKRENKSLSDSYLSLEKRFVNYQDTIVPAYKEIIKTKDANFNQVTVLFNNSEKLLKKQRLKKWLWLIVAGLTGYFVGSTL
jgi:hypothetical protein